MLGCSRNLAFCFRKGTYAPSGGGGGRGSAENFGCDDDDRPILSAGDRVTRKTDVPGRNFLVSRILNMPSGDTSSS